MPSVTKLAYLNSYLYFKVKKCMNGLPFSSKVCNRAKRLLLDKHGKESEIVQAHMRQIFELPIIANVNTHRIHEFCVQALLTLGKLDQVNGCVSMTLDKLPAIRGDLVRTDPTWEQ